MALAVAATTSPPREPMKRAGAPLSTASAATSPPTVVFLKQSNASKTSNGEPSKTSRESLVSRQIVKLPDRIRPENAISRAKAAAIIAARRILRQDPGFLREGKVLSSEVEKIINIYMLANPDLPTLVSWLGRETSSYSPRISMGERIMVNIELRIQTYKKYIAHRTATWTNPQDRHAIDSFARELSDSYLMLAYSLDTIRNDIETSLRAALAAQAQVPQ